MHDFQFFTLETLIIQTIILFVILWVLNKFIFKPYLRYLDELEEKQKKLENDYKNIDKLIKEAETKKETILKEARNKWDSLISEAEIIGNKKRTSIIEKAELDAKDILESTRSEIEKEKLSMLSQIKSKLIDVIIKFNSKLFKEEKVSKDYVEKILWDIN